MTMILRPNSFC